MAAHGHGDDYIPGLNLTRIIECRLKDQRISFNFITSSVFKVTLSRALKSS